MNTNRAGLVDRSPRSVENLEKKHIFFFQPKSYSTDLPSLDLRREEGVATMDRGSINHENQVKVAVQEWAVEGSSLEHDLMLYSVLFTALLCLGFGFFTL